jgi:hypothetical protein
MEELSMNKNSNVTKLSLDLNMLIAILERYNSRDLVNIDFSCLSRVPGIIGLTYKKVKDKNNYLVYQVNEYGIIDELLCTSDESKACEEVLNVVGFSLS